MQSSGTLCQRLQRRTRKVLQMQPIGSHCQELQPASGGRHVDLCIRSIYNLLFLMIKLTCGCCNKHKQLNCYVLADSCYNCGQAGHLQRDCKAGDLRECYHCGQRGHLARDCKGKQEDLRECYNCGNTGHLSRNCPEAGDGDYEDDGVCFK